MPSRDYCEVCVAKVSGAPHRRNVAHERPGACPLGAQSSERPVVANLAGCTGHGDRRCLSHELWPTGRLTCGSGLWLCAVARHPTDPCTHQHRTQILPQPTRCSTVECEDHTHTAHVHSDQ